MDALWRCASHSLSSRKQANPPGFKAGSNMAVTDAIHHDRRRFLRTGALTMAAAQLGIFGRTHANQRVPREVAAIASAPEWLNSPRLTASGLAGKVVLVDFWTYTCINWLRTLPYVRAWAHKYQQGLVVIGVHTPEFPFERNVDNVRRAVQQMRTEYPIVIDNDDAIWRAFNNQYWPALYLLDGRGRVRQHHFGEGQYETSERAIQRLLKEAGASTVSDGVVLVDGSGFEAPADWTMGRTATVLNTAPGQILYRFHARDVHLVMGPSRSESPVRFRVSIDGQPPGAAHGLDIDESGNGTVREQRLYQLIRQPKPIVDRQFEIDFLDAGVETFAFTFG
jgi:thiol-disulfide isomerase/thioredoxin